jgi:DinB superfamily
VNNTSSTLISDTGLTTEEITRAARHLSVTRGYLVETVSGLSTAQWDFKPDDDTWSIAENLEHLVLIEGRVHAIIANMRNAPEPASSEGQIEMDTIVLNEVPKRSIKVKAPAPVCPANRWSGVEALQSFIAVREQTMQLLAAPLLRGRVMPHPLFGPWDGYQWLLAAGSHTARHTEQIREVKADRNFPQP